jgi:hypothetical protein
MPQGRRTPYSVVVARKGRRGQRATASPAPPPSPPPADVTTSRLALVITALAGIVPLAVYVATLTPTVAGGEAEASFARLDPAAARGFPPGSWEAAILSAYWKQYERFGFAVARLAAGHTANPEVSATAARVFEMMAERHPSPPAAVFKNLGVAYQGLSTSRPDAPAAMVRAWKRYLSMAPADDPDVAKIRQAVEETERTLATRTTR